MGNLRTFHHLLAFAYLHISLAHIAFHQYPVLSDTGHKLHRQRPSAPWPLGRIASLRTWCCPVDQLHSRLHMPHKFHLPKVFADQCRERLSNLYHLV